MLGATIAIFVAPSKAQTDPCSHWSALVSAANRDWIAIDGLQPADFTAESHGKPVQIVSVTPGDQPRRVVILLDSSGSVANDASPQGSPGAWKLSLSLALNIATSKLDHTELALIVFNEKVREELDFSAGQPKIAARLRQIANDPNYENANVKGRTALRDAAAGAIKLLGPATQSGVIYAITDGGDNASKSTEKELREKLTQGGTRFFAAMVITPLGIQNQYRSRTPEELEGFDALPRFAADTAGAAFGPVMADSSGSVTVFDSDPSSRATVGDLLANFYRTIAHGYRVELELPRRPAKWSTWKLEPSKSLRSRFKDIRLGFTREIPPCEAAGH